jgi:glucan phosphoethanolaminetransferase (alkaline phosphatase superfamily)
MAHAVIFKKEKLVKIYLWFFAATALVTISVFLTGDPSSEYLKSVFPGVNNDLIENHETFGYISLIIILVLGVSGLVALRFFKSKEILPAWFKYSFLIVALISVFAISWAGKTGGDIRHSEITAEHTIIK